MRPLQFLKNHFFAGLFVFTPLGVIAWILSEVFRFIWSVHAIYPVQWKPDVFLNAPFLAALFDFILTLGLSLLVALGIAMLGWTSKQYLGKKILDWIGEWIQRIPLIRTVYSALDQLLKTFATGNGQQFSRVVYVEYPRKGMLALAFVTGPASGPSVPKGHLNVYVPTTPNPTSGFHLIVPETEVRESGLRVEEAFKTILSLGIAQSGDSHG